MAEQSAYARPLNGGTRLVHDPGSSPGGSIDKENTSMLPWGRWVIVCGTVFELTDWDSFDEIATIGVVQ